MVDPETAQVHAVSDPIPHVFGGALLDISSVDVDLDRKNFSLNPTNCSPMAVGGDAPRRRRQPGRRRPRSPPSRPRSRSSCNGCEGLGFKPKLSLQMFGATRRAKNPKLKAVLSAREGDANLSRAAVTLPQALFLDQSNIAKVCTRTQFAANACPDNSRLRLRPRLHAAARQPLEGPVYLRSSNNILPDLVASLRGQVDIDLPA